MPRSRNILIVDDHPIFRKGLRGLLEESGADFVVGEAGDAETALALVRDSRWDVVVLDLALPDKHGLQVLKEIRRLRPLLPVLMLSLYPEREFALRALRAGASGYLTKEQAPSELLKAMTDVLAGGRYVTPALADRLVEGAREPFDGQPHDQLSNRELEVLRLFGQGKTVSAIADRLTLSVKTVSTYRTRLLEKLHLSTTAELIRYAIEHRLTA